MNNITNNNNSTSNRDGYYNNNNNDGDDNELFNLTFDYYYNLTAKINFFLMSFGLIANTICILVFSSKRLRKCKFNVYLLILAVIELFYCLIVWLDVFCVVACTNPRLLTEMHRFYYLIIPSLAYTLDAATVIITLLLSIDRLYAIFRPMKIKTFATHTHLKLLVALSLALCFVVEIIAIPIYFLTSEVFYYTYRTIIASCILVILPATIILVLNTILFIKIINHDKLKQNIRLRFTLSKEKRKRIKDKEKAEEEKKLRLPSARINNYHPLNRAQKSHFVVIIMIGLWLLLTEVPFNLLILIIKFGGKYEKFYLMQFASSIFLNSNHCINIFIHIFFHDMFYKRLKQSIMFIYKNGLLSSSSRLDNSYISTTTGYRLSNAGLAK